MLLKKCCGGGTPVGVGGVGLSLLLAGVEVMVVCGLGPVEGWPVVY